MRWSVNHSFADEVVDEALNDGKADGGDVASLWDPERELSPEEVKRLVGRKGYPLTQLFIEQKNHLLTLLEARGFRAQSLPFKSIVDQMLEFCQKRCPDLEEEVRKLISFKHLVVECWQPLLERLLPREEEDLAEAARERARIALWQALDHLNCVNPAYVARWIRQGVARGLGRRSPGKGAALSDQGATRGDVLEGAEVDLFAEGGEAEARRSAFVDDTFSAARPIFVPFTEGRGGERPEDGTFNLNMITEERLDELAAQEVLSEEAVRGVAGEVDRSMDYERLRRGIKRLKERLRQMGSADTAEKIDRFLEEAEWSDGIPGLFRRFTRDEIARIRSLAYSIPELVEFI
ncbi:hypothetical protein [Thermosulfurimonas sp. F29]|uniref:hypothetical protein n=1 Tax=Thermosulfurimonas sp. F29 TaxID=2867247 RepID=UPI001C838AFC|nr:hypothetical protein [Thermosulfurimonas sp. F29]MBX6424210.1 hypothetical protein [Thermosulfurimonas sp. F29]